MTERTRTSTGPTPPADTSPGPASRVGSGPSPASAVVVRIPGPLRPLAGGADEVEVRGATVAEVLERLVLEHPGLRRHLLTDAGGVRDYVNVFVADEDARTLDGTATAVRPGEIITIVPSIAGG